LQGKSLGSFEVLAPLGKGGMGEVLRARDTDLDREVALKILPDAFAQDSERVARFRREAKVLASLNHPHIAQMYGLQKADDVTFLVMELVEGEDLQERLRRGPIPLDEALPLARQLALALEAAHAQGIVHRDLKPANIVCRPDGTLKVLDFGLAKVTPADASSDVDLANSPTVTSQGTLPGVILGTASYMSPEQARGRPTDARCDLWAFGAVLMEMLSGRQVFPGDTVSDVLAGVLKSEPAWSLLPDDLPRPIERVLRRCLQKDPVQRLHHAADARLEIEDAMEGPVEELSTSRSWSRLPWTFALLAIAVAVVFALRGNAPSTVAPTTPLAFDIEWAGDDAVFVSPDGSHLAWIGPERPEHVIHVRGFDGSEARKIQGTDIVTQRISWSFDGKSILYFTADALARVPIEQGVPEVLCTVPRGGRGMTQASDGTILVEVGGNAEAAGWYVLRPGRRELEPYERPRAVETGQTLSRPRFLPDGESFVFAQHVDGVRQAILGRLDSAETVLLFQTDTEVLPTEHGYVYGLRGALLHRPFSGSDFSAVGEPRMLAQQVGLFAPTGYLHATAARNGTIVYTTDTRPTEAVWYDAEGNELDTFFQNDKLQGAKVSPTGTHVVTILEDFRNGTGDLWSHDLKTDIVTRLTETEFAEFAPRWSPDGRSIAFSADRAGPPNLYVMDARGGAPVELTPPDQTTQYPTSWTPDGRRIVYMRNATESWFDIEIIDAAPGTSAEGVVRTSDHEASARVSPNGQWIVYFGYRSGNPKLWVRRLDAQGVGDPITVQGGSLPEWLDDDTILYLTSDNTIAQLDLDLSGERVIPGRPEVLITSEYDLDGFSLHPDGRILVVRETVDAYQQVGHVLIGQLRRSD
jgi:serine/threonine protein kinase